MNEANKKIKELDKKVQKAELEKSAYMKKNNLVFCFSCDIAYKKDYCKITPVFEKDGFFDCEKVVCPKGHKFEVD